MQAFDIEEAEEILQRASELDDDCDRDWIFFVQDPQYQTLWKVFAPENFSHYDDDEEWVEVDTAKAMKKALRKVDIPELLRFAFDFGRLIGRAEYTILREVEK